MTNAKILVVGTSRGDIHDIEWDGTLEHLQHLVGGYIELAAPVDLRTKAPHIQMLVHEEGLPRRLKPNKNLYPFFFVGPAVFIRVTGEGFAGLSGEDFKLILKWMKELDCEDCPFPNPESCPNRK